MRDGAWETAAFFNQSLILCYDGRTEAGSISTDKRLNFPRLLCAVIALPSATPPLPPSVYAFHGKDPRRTYVYVYISLIYQYLLMRSFSFIPPNLGERDGNGGERQGGKGGGSRRRGKRPAPGPLSSHRKGRGGGRGWDSDKR